MSRLTIVAMLMVTALPAFSQKTSLLGGPWNLASTWLPIGVPGPADDVIINGAVTLNANASCNSILVNSGGSFSFNGNAARTLSCSGNVSVASGASFMAPTNSNATHTINLGGNMLVDGTCNLATDNNSRAILSCVASGSRTLSGVGSCTLFKLAVNMGSTANNELAVTVRALTCTTDFLTLSNGTLRLQPTDPCTLTPFNTSNTITSTSALRINSPSLTVNMNSSVVVRGMLEVSSGILRLGNGNDEDLASDGGTVCVNGGSLTVAGKYYCTGPSVFSLTAGTFVVPGNASSNTTAAPFDFTIPGSTFVMSGGTLNLRREGGSGATNLGLINTATNAVVTGGTVQVGEASMPTNQIMNIQSTVPIPNLVVAHANARAAVAAGTSLTINGDVSVQSGSLLLQTGHLFVGGNWSDYGGLSAATGTVTFNSGSAQSLSCSARPFSVLQFSGSGVKSFSSDVYAGTVSVTASSTVDVTPDNRTLAFTGNFTNDGVFVQRRGNVMLTGTTNQQIGGSAATTFYDLTLANSSGATLQNDVNLEGALHLQNGTLNVNNRVFTLLSGLTTNARIAEITGGDISGNITMQRFVPAGYTGWALLGAPISPSVTLAQWDDDTYITCPTCPDGFMNFYSVYTYDETVAGTFDAGAAYDPLSGLSDPVTPGKGFWIYLGNGQTTTTSFLMDVTGPPQKFGFAIPLNYTNHGSASDDGWNLIANPYPSPVSWNALHGGSTNVDDAIYVYNADLASGSGGYASYVNGASSPLPAAGGIGDEIPAWQGFYVHSTGGTSLNAQESVKVSSSQPLLGPSVNVRPILRLQLAKSGRSDEALLYCQNGAGEGFDKRHDAYKLGSSDPLAPVVALAADSVLLQISGIPEIHGTYSTALVAKSGYPGTYTLSASQLSGFAASACISVFDRVTKTTTDLRTSRFILALPDTCTTPRFILRISSDSLPTASSVSPPTCASPSGGRIIAKPGGAGPWDFTWNKNGNNVRNVTGRTLPDTLDNLDGGSYDLTVSAAAQCAENTRTFLLSAQEPVVAQFNAPSAAMLLSGSAVIAFTSNCTNAAGMLWTFDKWGSQSTATDPVHVYTVAGYYTVDLKATSPTGCEDSAQKQIWVMPGLVTSLQQQDKAACAVISSESDEYVLYNGCGHGTIFRLTDGSGRTLMERTAGNHESFNIRSAGLPPGLYYLSWHDDKAHPVLKLVMN